MSTSNFKYAISNTQIAPSETSAWKYFQSDIDYSEIKGNSFYLFTAEFVPGSKDYRLIGITFIRDANTFKQAHPKNTVLSKMYEQSMIHQPIEVMNTSVDSSTTPDNLFTKMELTFGSRKSDGQLQIPSFVDMVKNIADAYEPIISPFRGCNDDTATAIPLRETNKNN